MNSFLGMATDTSMGGNNFAPAPHGQMQVGVDTQSLLALLLQILSAPQGNVVGNPQNQMPVSARQGPVP